MKDIEFRFVQPNEFDDWYYEYYHGRRLCNLVYYDGEWCIATISPGVLLTEYGLEKLIEKINELNKNTKPKNKFGF